MVIYGDLQHISQKNVSGFAIAMRLGKLKLPSSAISLSIVY